MATRGWLGFAVVAWLAACGSSGSGGGVGDAGMGAAGFGAGGTGASGSGATAGVGASSAKAACDLFCGGIVKIGCGDDELDPSTCGAKCPPAFTPIYPQCGTQIDAWASCFASSAAQLECKAGHLYFSGCREQLSAYQSCAACLPLPTDDSCKSCRKNACCSQMQAYVSDLNGYDFSWCLSNCGTAGQTCLDGCEAKYPSVPPKLSALVTCLDSTCQSECAAGTGGMGGTGGSGGSGFGGTGGGAGTGAGGGAGGGYACDINGQNPSTKKGSCIPNDTNDECQICIQQNCCWEWMDCTATNPGNACGWGGPNPPEGEISCFQSCFVAATAGGMAPQDAMNKCGGDCVSSGCGTISSATNALVDCLFTNCYAGCLM